MRHLIIAAGMALAITSPVVAQIDTSVADESMKPFFDKANKCLNDFDTRAKAKGLSADTYRTALEGACTEEITNLRGLYSLHLEGHDSQGYLLDRFDENIKDARAKLVTSYVMR